VFRTECLNCEDEEYSGRYNQVIVPESMDAVHSLSLANQRISAKTIAETQAIS
jgi:hypothetical protein